MSGVRAAVFETGLGPCGVAWGANGVVAFQLPEASPEETRVRLTERASAELVTADCPRWIEQVVIRVRGHLAGELDHFRDVPLDLANVSEFRRAIYEALRDVGPGETITYGDLASQARAPAASRAVGLAMAKNPIPLLVPCHRVLARGGAVGGFSAHGGTATKLRLLALEGAASTQPTLPLFVPTPGILERQIR